MSSEEPDIDTANQPIGGAASPNQDDFVVSPRLPARPANADQDERRLHLRAFDYWHALHAVGDFPLFTDLTPAGLSPFKRNSLLLEFKGDDVYVRYSGEGLHPVLSSGLSAGASLQSAGKGTFAYALAERFALSALREQAAEFEYIEAPVECRGIILPLSAQGVGAQFAMVVINHREHAADTATVWLQARARACEVQGASVVHPDNSSREGLYQALAETFRFHIDAARDPMAYRLFLRDQGLRQQRRAPFTPALKLTFGKSYDKTRLTEYAAALSYAARCEIGPDGLVEFLKNMPGGIKGCVLKERAIKQGKGTVDDDAAVARTLQFSDAQQLSDLQFDEPFALALVRKNAAGGVDIVAPVRAGKAQLTQSMRQVALALTKENEQP